MEIPHISVLPHEVLEAYKSLDKGVFIDCTLGFGGHTFLLACAHENLRFVGFDQDEDALNFAKKRLEKFKQRIRFFHGKFSDGIEKFRSENIVGILADIGVSSFQLDCRERGFGFDSDFLDMRMDKRTPFSACDIINGYTEEELERIFREYGELSRAKDLAKKIIQARKRHAITTPSELLEIIGHGKERGRKVSMATLVFQALRVEVNGELDELKSLLNSIQNLAPKGAFVGIISFHSLEDGIVKNIFKKWGKSCICPSDAYKCTCGNNHALGKIITKKPLTPSEKEIKQNPRSRSSKFRVFKFAE